MQIKNICLILKNIDFFSSNSFTFDKSKYIILNIIHPKNNEQRGPKKALVIGIEDNGKNPTIIIMQPNAGSKNKVIDNKSF